MKPGQRTEAFAENVDLYPTLCELAGVPLPIKPDGMSLVQALRDPQSTSKDHAFHVYPRHPLLGRSIRTERHRFVEWKAPGAAPDTAVLELYDYQKDPLEKKNIAGEDVTTLASMAKYKMGKMAEWIPGECLRFWGGQGFMHENRISRTVRPAAR